MADSGYHSVIESLGVYLPPKKVSSKEILRACRVKMMLPLQRLTGIKTRRMAGESEFSIDLARRAIQECLDRSKYGPGDVELLICCNISRYDGPNFHFSFEPSTSVQLKRDFGLDNALVFDISNACAGMFTGINIADSYIRAGFIKRALVVSGEYITHLTVTAQKEILNRDDERIACLTLGDSGAAVMLERTDNPKVGFHAIDMYTLGKFSEYCIAKPTKEEHGGAIMLTESMKLHAVAIRESVRHFGSVLLQLKWPRDAINYVIMHQTARTAISQTANMINRLMGEEICDKESMINNLAERGNTSTTTHFVALWDNIAKNKFNPGDTVIFAIQASGITIGTAPYTFDDLPVRMREIEAQRPAEARMPAALGGTAAPVAEILPKTAEPSISVSISPISLPRIRIESIGIVPLDSTMEHDAVALAGAAAEDCFNRSVYQRQQIDMLIHSGVHRNEFVCEPALAALIAGRVGVNGEAEPDGPKTFAYDVFNGAIGFLNACYNAIAMIAAKKCDNIMVVASEVENNTGTDKELLGVRETGSALILDRSEDNRTGFGSFVFRYFTDYIDAFRSHIGQEKGLAFLSFIRNPEIETYYLQCIKDAVCEVMLRENLKASQIKAIFPPQISSEFITRMSESLGIVREKFVDVVDGGKDLFTSSLPHTLRRAQETNQVQNGDIGLIINVGSGIQVGCAIYYF